MLRIIYVLGLLGAVVFMPWYVVLAGVIAGLFFFPVFIEGVIVLVLIDGLYGFAGSTPRMGLYTVIGVISLVVVKYLKKHLTWYS